jgi:proteasome accessory factor B
MRENKLDRIARLHKVEHLLYQAPAGLTINEISAKCGVSTRTTRRDMATLEAIGVPIWEDTAKRGITPGYFLPPISFTLPEALTIFIAARLLLAYSNAYNPNIESTFIKLSSAVPSPIRNQIERTLSWMQKLPQDDHFRRVMDILANAWINGRKVRITYQALGKRSASERVIEPYFIQPASLEHATYVIGFCHHSRKVLTFKVERITQIELLEDHYTVSKDFDANTYLGSAWGISVYGQPEQIQLKFNSEVGRIANETRWHPSQVTKVQRDGSALVTFNLSLTHEFVAFILWWGDKVEVLKPESLKKDIRKIAGKILALYKTSKND